jgi:hypothetical protein
MVVVAMDGGGQGGASVPCPRVILSQFPPLTVALSPQKRKKEKKKKKRVNSNDQMSRSSYTSSD